MNLGAYTKALSDFNRGLELNPENYNLFLYRGTVKFELGAYEESIMDYTTYLKFRPDDPVGYTHRAISKATLNDQEGAMIDCNKAIEVKPDYSNVYFTRGGINFDLKQYVGSGCFIGHTYRGFAAKGLKS